MRTTFGASRESDPQNFDEFCRNMISKYDNDLDGSLTFEEFSKIIVDFNKSAVKVNDADDLPQYSSATESEGEDGQWVKTTQIR